MTPMGMTLSALADNFLIDLIKCLYLVSVIGGIEN